MSNTKVLVFPKDRNPYQGLLYSGVLKEQCEIEYFALDKISFLPFTPNSIRLLSTALYYRIKGFSIFHLHWVYPFTLPNLGYAGRIISTLQFLGFHLFLKCIGMKIVYTVHNIKPHEKVFINDIGVMKLFSKLVDEHIVHSKSTIQSLRNVGIHVSNYTVMPMGSYEGFYKKLAKGNAKEELGVSKNNTVITFLGIIRPYKGIETIMAVFEKVLRNEKNVTCIIAGESLDPQLKKDLENFKGKNFENLILMNRSISKDELGTIMSATDAFLYPVKNITSSSTILLTSTYGVPIIAPRKGELLEMPEDIGFWVTNDSFDAYYQKTLRAIRDPEHREHKSKSAQKYADEHPWSKSQQILLDTYLSLR